MPIEQHGFYKVENRYVTWDEAEKMILIQIFKIKLRNG